MNNLFLSFLFQHFKLCLSDASECTLTYSESKWHFIFILIALVACVHVSPTCNMYADVHKHRHMMTIAHSTFCCGRLPPWHLFAISQNMADDNLQLHKHCGKLSLRTSSSYSRSSDFVGIASSFLCWFFLNSFRWFVMDAEVMVTSHENWELAAVRV